MSTDHDRIRQWCLSLTVLTTVTISRDDLETKLAAYVPMLAREFPAAAFTADSLAHVGRACPHGFPTYGELATALATWWHEHRPSPHLAITSTAEPVHDPERWITFWRTRCGENFDRSKGRSPRNLLDLIRCRSANVYNWLIEHDDRAAETARIMGWGHETVPSDRLPSDTERDAVHVKVEQIIATLQAHSPHQPSQPGGPPDAAPRPIPRHLTPAQLDQLNPLPGGLKRSG